MKHRVFISYHHSNDQWYKDELIRFGKENDIFLDWSVDTGDISDNLSDQEIREIIRDEYLQTCRVTILLVGTETKKRKHIDWELYSSMYNGKVNKKSGIVVILLPSAKSEYCTAANTNEKSQIYPNVTNWINIDERAEYERRYPYMPERIIDNLLNNDAKISVVNWKDINVDNLRLLIENAYNNADSNDYDLSRPMRRKNS